MNNANTIRSILENQRKTKINRIQELERQCDKINEDLSTIEQLLSLTDSELQKFASVLTEANKVFNNQQFDQPAINQISQQPKSSIPVIKQPNQPQPASIPQNKKSIGNMLKKKDVKEREMNSMGNEYIYDDNGFYNDNTNY